MDFTIRLRAEGTAETRAQAEAVKAVRSELEATIATAKAAGVAPKAVFDAAKTKQKKEDGSSKDAGKKVDAEKKKRDDIAKATEKANKDLEKYAKEESKAAEQRAAEAIDPEMKKLSLIEKAKKNAAKRAEQLEAEKIDPEMRALSKVEQAKKNAAKKADEEMAARIDPSVKKLSETEKAKQKLFGRIGTGIMLAGGAASTALAGVASKLAPLALGYMGMARLSLISAQASFNMRRLFMGTDPRPLLDALQRTGQLIDPRTFTGKTLGDFLVRSSNSLFAMLAKAEPYARLFFKGMLLGALQVESAWLKLRIAIQPALNMFPVGTGLMASFGAGALLVKASFGLMGAGIAIGAVKAAAGLLSFGRAALVATAPLLPYAAAIGAIALALKQAVELKQQWDENSANNLKEGVKRTLGFTSEEEYNANLKGIAKASTPDEYERRHKMGKYAEKPTVPIPKGAEKQAAAAGPPIGKNLGLGMLAGMKDVEGKVAVGGRDLVLAAEGGAKKEAVIRSPSDKWRKQIGRQLGAGAALGLEDSADRMEEAGRAVVPSAPMVSGSRSGRGGVVIQSIGPFYGMPEGGEAQVRRWVVDAIDDMAERIGALAN